MQSRNLLAAFLVIAVLGVSAALTQAGPYNGVNSGECVNETMSKKTKCFDRTIESEDGFGAVELCGDCFICGYDDGVCPESFGANCSKCPDADCRVTLQGYVYEEGGTPESDGINDVTVTAVLPHSDSEFDTTTRIHPTNSQNGYFNFSVPRGVDKLTAEKDSYAIQYFSFPEGQTAEPYKKNVTLHPPSCSADPTCTLTTELGPRCDPSCDDKKGCDYTSGTYNPGSITYDTAENCSGKSPSRSIFLGTINSTHQLRVTCCNGTPYEALRPKAKVDTNVSNIVVKEDGGPLVNDKGDVEEPYVKIKYYFYNRD